MVGYEIGHGATGLYARPPCSARLLGGTAEPAADEVLQRIVPVDGREAGDRPAAPGDDNIGASFDPIEVLAESVVQLANANPVLPRM